MCGQWVGISIMSAPAAAALPASSAASSGEKPARLAMTSASPSLARLIPSVNQYEAVLSEPNTALSMPDFTSVKQGSTSGAGRDTMVFVQMPATPLLLTAAIVGPSLPCTPAGTMSGFLNESPQNSVFKSTATRASFTPVSRFCARGGAPAPRTRPARRPRSPWSFSVPSPRSARPRSPFPRPCPGTSW